MDLRAARCLGPTNARSFAVYLHGIDSAVSSDLELKNRTNLARIAASLSMRIALPRATLTCPNQKSSLCWGWSFDEAETDTASAIIDRAAKECFGDRPFGLIGFSNGGYLVSKLMRQCLARDKLPRVSWMVAIGSAAFKGALEPRPESLVGCGRLVLLTGTEDTFNFDPTDRFVHLLEAKGADVRAVRFDGGHLVPEESLERVLRDLVARP